MTMIISISVDIHFNRQVSSPRFSWGYILVPGLVAKLVVKKRPRKSFSDRSVRILDYGF